MNPRILLEVFGSLVDLVRRLGKERRSAASGTRDKNNRNDKEWFVVGRRLQISRQRANGYGGRAREIYRLTLATLLSLRRYVQWTILMK